MNRGSQASLQATTRSRRCFNEAPIHESGKYWDSTRPCSDFQCFNEAPIHESGKWHLPCADAEILYASMRPRFMNRGSNRMPSHP